MLYTKDWAATPPYPIRSVPDFGQTKIKSIFFYQTKNNI